MEYVGVCYGMDGNNLPAPQKVIDICKSENIKKMRIYRPNLDVMQALGESGIVLIQGVPKEDIGGLANVPNAARNWVQKNVQQYISNVNFSYIAVGIGVKPSDQVAGSVLLAMENINDAIISFGLKDKVKVSTAIDSTILGDFQLPSQAMFSIEAKSYIEPILRFLDRTQAPLLANVQPYCACVNHPSRFSLPFALFTATPRDFIHDGPFTYKNLFDFMLDGIYCAVEKLGFQSLVIVVSETGWPSTGGPDANIFTAIIYYTNLIGHVTGGTPRRRRPIEAYLSDENGNSGLFNPDGQAQES